MPINLELPKKFKFLITQANQVAQEVLRPNSRKYDRAEHSYPKELDMLAALIDGMNDGSSELGGAGADRRAPRPRTATAATATAPTCRPSSA